MTDLPADDPYDPARPTPESLKPSPPVEDAIEQAYREAIQERRRVALGDSTPDSAYVPAGWGDAANPNYVGLSLSGGGLRSALFNVGLLQAFSHRGLLRYVDFISSVSGGGYASGWLMARHQHERLKLAQARQHAGAPLAPDTAERPPAEHESVATSFNFHGVDQANLGLDPRTERIRGDYRLGNAGNYLNQPLEFLWQYVSRTIPMLLMFWGMIFAGAALIGLLWRTLDQDANRGVLAALGLMNIIDELFCALLPAVFLGGAWLLSLVVWSLPVSLIVAPRKLLNILAPEHPEPEAAPPPGGPQTPTIEVRRLPGLVIRYWPGLLLIPLSLIAAAYSAYHVGSMGWPAGAELAEVFSATHGEELRRCLFRGLLAALIAPLPLWLIPAGIHNYCAWLREEPAAPPPWWLRPEPYLTAYLVLILREPLAAFFLDLAVSRGERMAFAFSWGSPLAPVPLVCLGWLVWCGIDSLRRPEQTRPWWRHPVVLFAILLVLMFRLTFLELGVSLVSATPLNAVSVAPQSLALSPILGFLPGMWRAHLGAWLVGGLVLIQGLWRIRLDGYGTAPGYGTVPRPEPLEHAARRSRQQYRCVCRALFALTIFAIAIGIAVFLGNSESKVWSSQTNFQLNNFATGIAVTAGLLQIVPAFFNRRFLNSDREDATALQRGTYAFFTWIAPLLLLFAAIHLMAREDLSRIAVYRDPELMRTDFVSWTAEHHLQDMLRDDPTTSPSLTPTFSEMTSRQVFDQGSASQARGFGRGWDEYYDRPTSWNGFVSLMGSLVYYRPTEVEIFLQDRVETRQRAEAAAAAFNRQLPEAELTARLITDLWERVDPKREGVVKGLSGRMPQPQSKAFEDWITGQRSLMETNWSERSVRELRRYLDLALAGPAADIDKTDASHPKDIGIAPELRAAWRRSIEDNVERWSAFDIRACNRLLLEILEPRFIRPREMVTTPMVAEYDQRARVGLLLFWAAVATLGLRFLDFNRCGAIFAFYRQRLSQEFLECDPYPNDGTRGALLRDLDGYRDGLAIPLYCAARLTFPSIVGVRRTPRGVTFSPLSVGWQTDAKIDPNGPHHHKARVERARENEVTVGRDDRWWVAESMASYATRSQVSLADVMTVSGSAVTPLAMPNWPLAVILTMFNLRLGYWFAGPHAAARDSEPAKAAAPRSISELPCGDPWIANAGRIVRRQLFQSEKALLCPVTPTVDSQPDELGPYFIADGGFDEFLGAIELLRRRCRLVIISDAGSNSGKDEFGALSYLIRVARVELGIRFYDLETDEPIELDRFRRRKDDPSRVPQQFFCCRAVYPADPRRGLRETEATVVYLQMSLTGREEIDLQQVRLRFPNFPDEPISNQFYTEQQAEAYRQLGHHIGRLICRELPPWREHPGWRADGDARSEHPAAVPDFPVDNPANRRVLSFEELTARLKLAYFWECHREVMHEKSEVSVQRLFDSVALQREAAGNEELRLHTLVEAWGKKLQDLVADRPASNRVWSTAWSRLPAWLIHSYEIDADLRIAVRQFVFETLCDHAQPRSETRDPAFRHPLTNLTRESPEPQPRTTLVLLPVIAVAVNELLVCDESRFWIRPSLDEGTWREPGTTPLRDQQVARNSMLRTIYQVGGRDVLEEPFPPEAYREDVGRLSGSEARRLYRIAFDVFREHGPATALLTRRCLEAVQRVETGVTSEPAADDQRITKARDALRKRNVQEFIESFH